MPSSSIPIALALAAATTAGCAERPTDGDSDALESFDIWCGDSLCDWSIERGSIAPVGTWHSDDPGVSIGDDTAIRQVIRSSGLTPPPSLCYRVELVANVVPTANLQLNIDVYADGTTEQTFDLPAGAWTPAKLEFAVKQPFNRLGLEIVKNGRGSPSILAHLRVTQVREGCEALEPLDGGPAPQGATCRNDAGCATSLCVVFPPGGRCSRCDPDHSTCPDGTICGVGDPLPEEPGFAFACIAPGARVLTERCNSDAECESGLCVSGICSACRADADCDGVTCATSGAHGTHLCGLGQRLGKPGDPCVDDLDCASRCRGPVLRECLDRRPCNVDADCADDIPRHEGECQTVGIQGGVCD